MAQSTRPDSLLLTSATSQIITRGVTLEPATGAQSGGGQVVYHLTVTNTGSITDTITLEASGYTWATAVSPIDVSLPSLGQAGVAITVTIPATATNGQLDVVTITAQATGVSDSSQLTTRAAVVETMYLRL